MPATTRSSSRPRRSRSSSTCSAACSPRSCSPIRWPTRTTATTRSLPAWRCRPGCSRRRSASRTPTARTPSTDEIIGAPPVFFFEPHQPEQSDFKPNVLLDITAAFPLKQKAMECLPAQKHMWEYYTSLAIRRGVQVKRNAGRQPRPAGRHDGRGVRAVLPAGHGRPAVTGHVVVTDIQRADAATVDALAALGSATVHEAMGRIGYAGAGIRPIQQGAAIAGSAVTVLVRARRQPHGPCGDRAGAGRRRDRRGAGDRFALRVHRRAHGHADAGARRARLRHVRRRPRHRRAARDGLPRLDRARQRAGHRERHRRFGERAGRARRRGRPPGRRRRRRRRRRHHRSARARRRGTRRRPSSAPRKRPPTAAAMRTARSPWISTIYDPCSTTSACAISRRRNTTVADPVRDGVRCMLMRGGTSKGAYFLAADVPLDPRGA